jgi:hypothetical protein
MALSAANARRSDRGSAAGYVRGRSVEHNTKFLNEFGILTFEVETPGAKGGRQSRHFTATTSAYRTEVLARIGLFLAWPVGLPRAREAWSINAANLDRG